MADVMQALKDIETRLSEQIKQKQDELVVSQKKTVEEAQKDAAEQLQKVKNEIDEVKKQVQLRNDKSIPGAEFEKDKFSFLRALQLTHPMNAHLWGKKDYGLEVELLRNVKDGVEKAQTAGDGTAGGYTVASQLADTIIEPAIAAMPIYQLGITKIDNIPAGLLEIPTLETRGTAGHASETGSATEATFTYGVKKLSPNRCDAYTKVSRRLLSVSTQSFEQFTRQQLQLAVQLKMHQGLVAGKGAENEPRGLANISGFTNVDNIGGSGGQFTVKHASRMKTDLEEADFPGNVQDGMSPGFLLRPKVAEGMKIARTTFYSGQTTGKGFQLVNNQLLSDTELESVLGVKFRTTSHVAASSNLSTVYYGLWKHFILALWGGMEMRASDVASDGTHNAFVQNLVFFLVMQEYDCTIDLPAAFCKITDASTDRSAWSEY